MDHKKDLSQADVLKTLLRMTKDGQLISNCAKCGLPLSYNDLKMKKCDKCGKISNDDMLFQDVSRIVLN